MKAIVTLLVLIAFGIFGAWCYRKGASNANAMRDAERNTEYQNDANSDPSVKHSLSYNLGYGRGRGNGIAETLQTQTIKCSEQLAELAVESGNTKVAGKYLAEGYFAPSQLEAAAAKLNRK
jgi:hypothetical protein